MRVFIYHKMLYQTNNIVNKGYQLKDSEKHQHLKGKILLGNSEKLVLKKLLIYHNILNLD